MTDIDAQKKLPGPGTVLYGLLIAIPLFVVGLLIGFVVMPVWRGIKAANEELDDNIFKREKP